MAKKRRKGCVLYSGFNNSITIERCSLTNRFTIIDILRSMFPYRSVPGHIWTVEFVKRVIDKVEDSGLTRQKMVWSCQNHARPCVTLKPSYVVLSTGRDKSSADNKFIIHLMWNCPILVVVHDHREAWLQDSRIIIRGRGCTQHSVARRVVRLQYCDQLYACASWPRILTVKISFNRDSHFNTIYTSLTWSS